MSGWVTREVTSQERKPARGRFPERGKTAAVAPARAGSAKPATGGRISPGQVPDRPLGRQRAGGLGWVRRNW